jgi:hypothetical protein
MPAYYDPLLFPIDSILLKGLESPGIARIRNAESKRKVDVRSAYGISATVAVWKEVAEPEVVIELRTAVDWEAWAEWSTQTVLREMRPNTRYTAKQVASDFSLDIWHPWLEMLDIKSVIVTSVSQPVEIEPTVWAITIKFIEYRKPVQTLAKPAASKQKEQDGVDKLIDQQSAKIRDTVQKLAE